MSGSPMEVPQSGTHLVLLGTVAGPVLHPDRAMASQAVVVNGRVYLFDCGYGAVARLSQARLKMADIHAVFFTHHHSDHNADYPNLVHLAWVQGLQRRVKVLGPPPMKRIHDMAIAFHQEDIDIRVRATGRTQPGDSFDVLEVAARGEVYADEFVKVTAALVTHPPFDVALAFRIDTADRSIVLSGDTAPCDTLVALARGADLLVHEAMYVPAIDVMLASRTYVPPTLRAFLTEGHTSAEECGRIAARAGVHTLVLSHLLPSDSGLVPEATWHSEAARYYSGNIVVGRDLMVL